MQTRVNQEHGPHRRPVGEARSAVSSEATFRRSRGDRGRIHALCSNGVLWILRTGAPWHDLPDRYPPYQTCHRRFQQWQRSGLLTRLLQKLAEDLRDRGKLDLSEAFIDASFSSAKKGALVSALLDAEKAAKSWQSQTAMVFLSPCTWPALRRMKRTSSKPPSRSVSPRSQTAAIDRRQRLRQRSAGSATARKLGRPTDRAAPLEPPSKPVTQDGRELRRYSSPLENRTPVCLAPQFPPHRQPLGISCRKFPRHGPTRLRSLFS